MIAPRYIPTDLQTLNHDRDFKKHQRKLDEITKQDRKKKAVDREGPVRAKQYETREKNLKFHNSEKLLAIEKDNEILLGRLVEISRKKGANGLLSSSAHLPKTLNGPSRQREKDRIAQENEAFAKRLLSQQARFDRKKLEVDYVKHIGLVKQMQRLDNPSSRKIKLPPIKNSPTEEEKEDIAEEEERREKEAKAKKEEEEKKKEVKEENDDKEAQEKKEKEEREAKEKKEREEKERKEKEEKEAQEKKEKEEKEKKEKEEAEKKAKEEAEKLEKDKQTGAQEPNTTAPADQTVTKTPEELEKERLQKEEEERKKNAQAPQ